MKKLVIMAIVLVMLLAGCGPSDEECDSAMEQLNLGAGRARYDSMSDVELQLILNSNHAPDSVGFQLAECINGGWDGYR